MQKLIVVLVALIACVLASEITPKTQCAMYYRTNVTSVSGDEVLTVITDTKMMYNGDMLYAYSNTVEFLTYTDFSMSSYERCDIKNGIMCYSNLIVSTGGSEEIQDKFEFFEPPAITNTWFYDDGPEDVECPYGGINGCKKYCNSTLNECVIFDSEELLIQEEGNNNSTVTMTYFKETVNVEDFVGTFENGTKMPVPVDICRTGSSSASVTKASLFVAVITALILLF